MANTPILDIPLLTTNQSNKETTINDAINFLEKASNAAQVLDLSGGDVTLTKLDVQRFFMFKTQGAAGPVNINLPNTLNKIFSIDNTDPDGSTVVLKLGAISSAIPPGVIGMYFANGDDLVLMNSGSGSTGGVFRFRDLIDVSTYVGQAGKFLRAKADGTGLEFATVEAGGGSTTTVPSIAVFLGGKMTGSETLFRFIAPSAMTFAAAAAKSNAAIAATASTTLTLKKNGTTAGTIVFAASGTTGTVTLSASIVLAANDVLSLHAPTTADTTLADVAITLTGA